MRPTSLESIVLHVSLIAQDLADSGYSNTRFQALALYFKEQGYLVDSAQATDTETYYTIEVPLEGN